MYNRKKMLEDLPEENTVIWSCSNKDCKGWMRDNFSFDENPTCRLCLSPMVSDIKMLPLLVNSKHELKFNKKSEQME